MSKKRQIRDYFEDILESISDIEEFTKGMVFGTFAEDKKTIKAVIRSLEVIGEAANKVPQEIKNGYPEIPWQEIIGMRNQLIHEYFGVDIDVVWETLKEDIIPLEEGISKIIKDLYS